MHGIENTISMAIMSIIVSGIIGIIAFEVFQKARAAYYKIVAYKVRRLAFQYMINL